VADSTFSASMGKRSNVFRGGTGDAAILHNKLTVGEAKHIIRSEGGVLTPSAIAYQVATVLAIAIFSARAIVLGEATAWHLFLPMVAEYLLLLILLPGVALYLRDPGMRKESRRGAILLAVIAAIGAGWITYQARSQAQPWTDAAAAQLAALRDWIVGAKMHWPILAALAARIGNLPARIAAFRRSGPPFDPVGIGCGMRAGLFVLGLFLLPWVVASSGKVVWALWTLILLAEAAALWMHLDIQMRLKKRGIEV
jgi:hypothetical protein